MTDNISINGEDTTFEDVKEHSFDDLQGSSEQVLLDAYVMNTGAALTAYDLFTEGYYGLHEVPGEYSMFAKKVNKNKIEVRTIVDDNAIKSFKLELAAERELNEARGKDTKKKYLVPPWIMAEALMVHNVHPTWSLEAWEKVIYNNYPLCWLDDAKRPRH